MEERVLKFTVVDVDRNRRHQTIGYALYPLRDHMYGYDEPIVIWRDLEKEVAEVSDVITCKLCAFDAAAFASPRVDAGRTRGRS